MNTFVIKSAIRILYETCEGATVQGDCPNLHFYVNFVRDRPIRAECLCICRELGLPSQSSLL
jgi:hypothetical protein